MFLIRRVFEQPEDHMNNGKMLNVNKKHTFEAFSRWVNYRKGQIQMKNICSTYKKHLGQSTSLRPSVPWEALDCFSTQFSGRYVAQFSFNDCSTWYKSFETVKGKGNLPFDDFRQWLLEKISLIVDTCIKAPCWKQCAISFSTQAKCITFRHAKLYMELNISWNFMVFRQKISAKILWENQKTFSEKGIELALCFSSPNQHSYAISGTLEGRGVTN